MRVETFVCRAAFAETLGAMRIWLDTRQCPPVRCETAMKGELIRISIKLSAPDLVQGFRETFDPAFDITV